MFSLDSITIRSMCGRAYKTYTEEELYFRYLSKRPLNLIDFTPIYNLCPTQNTLVLYLMASSGHLSCRTPLRP